MGKSSAKKADITPATFDALVRPLVTEKSTMASEHGKVVFEIPVDATKDQVKAAVESLYKVTVIKVNTLVQQGKVKRFRGMLGKRKDTKKAVVTLKQGDSIDVMTGIK